MPNVKKINLINIEICGNFKIIQDNKYNTIRSCIMFKINNNFT